MKTQDAISYFGSRGEVAKTLGITKQAVYGWISGKSKPSAKHAIAIERATNGAVKREQLRPDVFGPAPDAKAAP